MTMYLWPCNPGHLLQDVWHYHLHLFPRYEGDRLYASEPALSDAEERARYAGKLKTFLGAFG